MTNRSLLRTVAEKVQLWNKITIIVLLQSYRLGVFEANLKKIEEHNKEYAEGKHTWTMGVNRLADLTHEEFMQLNGLKVPDLPKKNPLYTMKAKTTAADVDWRDRVIITFSVVSKHKASQISA